MTSIGSEIGVRDELAGNRKRAGIQSVEIGLRVLEALRQLGRASPLAAIVRACKLSPSQTHRYLASLCVSGMVIQSSSGDYDLGPAALRLGLSALTRIDAFRVTDEALASYSSKSGATCQLAALGSHGPTIVRWYAGLPPIVTSLAIGSVLGLSSSATGLVFRAFRSVGETRALALAEKGAPKGKTIEKLLETVRHQGFATVDGSVIPGLNALACPIFDAQSRAMLVAAVLWTSEAPVETAEFLAVCERINGRIIGEDGSS